MLRNVNVDTPEKSAQERAVCLAYAITGSIYLTIGIAGLIVGAFTGPHVFFPALGFLVIGAASVATGFGLAAGSRKAHVAGIGIAAILTGVSLFAFVATLADGGDDWPAAFFWVAATAPVAAAGWTLLRGELKKVRQDVPPPPGPISN